MSAPDTKALPPAPVTTTTRMLLSVLKSSRKPSAASHISSETALWRSGLLKVREPILPSLRDSILSVIERSLNRLGFLQRLDLVGAETEFLQYLVGMLAKI